MKVLQLTGTKIDGILSPIIKGPTDILRDLGIEVYNYSVKKRGYFGYLKEIITLRQHLKNHQYDLVHAHFAFSGFLAGVSTRLPKVVSLMGGEAYEKLYWLPIIRIFSAFSWDIIIVKSKKMYDKLKIHNAYIIPNGVDLDKFKIIDKKQAKNKIKFDDNKHILFFSPSRYEKNYELANNAYKNLNNSAVRLNLISGVPHHLIPYYLNAADVLLLTSIFEGSPNVIKEAMACNLPIVSVDVGDVKKIIGKTNGCYIAKNEPEDIASKLSQALLFDSKTNGRVVIKRDLDQKIIAKKIIELYSKIIKKK